MSGPPADAPVVAAPGSSEAGSDHDAAQDGLLPARARLAWRPEIAFGLVPVALMLVWEVHDGGYDSDTWYWGGLVMLAMLAAAVMSRWGRVRIGRTASMALALFAAYVAWCYLSISWAQSPGDALRGANQALLYLLVYATILLVPWTSRTALLALLAYAIGVGATAIVLLVRFASADRVAALVVDGRLTAPTGYFNSTAALFTIGALIAIALAARRRLPGPLRGLLVALACADLQLALIVQSRGWLFTLPLVALAAIAAVSDRLRVVAMALAPIAGTLAILHRLLAVHDAASPSSLNLAAQHAGQPALLICFAVFVVGTLAAWGDTLLGDRPLSGTRRRAIGLTLAIVALAAVAGAGTAIAHGDPLTLIERQWNGFSHEPTSTSSASNFLTVGSGRYDFWRSSLDAFAAHPITGLGEDNFGDWYLRHRHTDEEPSTTHSLEFRLLAQTGIVGTLLFTGFMVCALWLAIRARRQREDASAAAIAGAGMLALAVWLIHGSIDWFWEMPALSGPALGFLAMAAALRPPPEAAAPERAVGAAPTRARRAAVAAAMRIGGPVAGAVALVAAVVVLGIPYLAVRYTSIGADAGARHPRAALAAFATASRLNPLSSVPDRMAGVVALQAGEPGVAQQRFARSISREPGGWFAWLGAGLAASEQGHVALAREYFARAHAIDDTRPVIALALARVGSRHPLTTSQAIGQLPVQ